MKKEGKEKKKIKNKGRKTLEKEGGEEREDKNRDRKSQRGLEQENFGLMKEMKVTFL